MIGLQWNELNTMNHMNTMKDEYLKLRVQGILQDTTQIK
jgi:hypothetical protein